MIQQQLRKAGNSFVVTIPKDEVERQGWEVGQRFVVQLTPLVERPVLTPDVQEALESSWKQNAAGYKYLADR